MKNMHQYKSKFLQHFSAKDQPDSYEQEIIQKTQKYMKYISWIPGLKMVALCNSTSYWATDKGSDIDLFIVTAPNRMWLVRILVTCIFQVL